VKRSTNRKALHQICGKREASASRFFVSRLAETGTAALTARLSIMHETLEPDALDFDLQGPDTFEPDVNEMVRRLAASLDEAIDPDGDARAVVAEALMRLALGVHLYAHGAAATRDKLLNMALRAHPAEVAH
jgi:hypothetical protein